MLFLLVYMTVVSTALANVVHLYAMSKSKDYLGILEEERQLDNTSYFSFGEKGTKLFQLNDNFVNRYGPNPEKSMSFDGNFLAMTKDQKAEKFIFDHLGDLQTEEKFWACKNVRDPQRISKKKGLIVRGDKRPNWWCRRVYIRAGTLYETVEAQVSSLLRNSENGGYIANVVVKSDAGNVPYFALSTTEPSTPILYRKSEIRDVNIDGERLRLCIVDGRFVMSAKDEPVKGIKRNKNLVLFREWLWVCDKKPEPEKKSPAVDAKVDGHNANMGEGGSVIDEGKISKNVANHAEGEEGGERCGGWHFGGLE